MKDKILKQYYEETDNQFQLVTPYMQSCNTAERVVNTFKDHFIAALFIV